MKERETTPGKTYSVHTMNGCTIIEPDGWQKTIEAPDGYFDAHFGSVVIEGDDEASIKPLFKLAPYQKLRLLGVVGGNAGGLPAGYKRVEYLKTTGEQYINTNIIVESDFSLLFQGEINLQAQTRNSYIVGALHKEIDNEYQYRIFVGAETQQNRVMVDCGAGWDLFNAPSNIYELNVSFPALWSDECKLSINGKPYTKIVDLNSVKPTLKRAKLILFGYSDGANDTKKGTLICKASSILLQCNTANGFAKLDLIPCLDSTGAPCMFDMVSKQPFYNQGTGDFLYPTERTTYALRRVLPDWGKLTEHGLRRLYHAPANYKGELYDYALENGYKPIVEESALEEGYWAPRWTETEDEIVLEWVETEPPTDEFGLPAEDLT